MASITESQSKQRNLKRIPNIRNAVARGKTWVGFSEADNFEIRENTATTNVSEIILNLDNICSIELLKEDKKNGKLCF